MIRSLLQDMNVGDTVHVHVSSLNAFVMLLKLKQVAGIVCNIKFFFLQKSLAIGSQCISSSCAHCM